MHTIAHRLTNYDIHFMIEIFPRQYLYVVLMIVFFDNLSHHVDILSLALTIAINYTIDLSATCFNSEKGIQTIYSFSQVKNCFSFEQISVLCHCIMVCFMWGLIFQSICKSLCRKIVDFGKMLRVVFLRFLLLSNIYLDGFDPCVAVLMIFLSSASFLIHDMLL